MIDIPDTLLAPLARLLVARGILFPELTERLKAHYVNAAKTIADGKVTDSRLSVLTGLQRRDITRLRGIDQKVRRPNHLARLVALWLTQPEYQAAGRAMELPKNGAEPSFEALARMVRKDVHPRTMLDTLLATQTIAFDIETQMVKLLKTSYQPLSGSEDQLAYLAQNLGDHMSAATLNVTSDDPPFFERAVHYSNLTASQVSLLENDYRAGQMALFEEISQKAARMQKSSEEPDRFRFRAGGYFYHEKDAS